jgi:hypothetical protein
MRYGDGHAELQQAQHELQGRVRYVFSVGMFFAAAALIAAYFV